MVQDGHQAHEENLPSLERPAQLPMYRPTTARVAQRLAYRPTIGHALAIERCKAGTSPIYPRNSHQTSITAPSTGTTTKHIRKNLQVPVPEHPAVQPLP